MNELFTVLDKKSEILEDIQSIIQDENDWQPYYNFMAKQIPDEVVQKDSFLKALYAKEPFMAGITKMNPATVYDWHTDSRRGVTINMLVDAGFCMTLYTTSEPNYVRPIRPVEYKPEHYHLFNTQIPHSVLNFDRPRYLFTIEFQKDRESFGVKELMDVLAELGVAEDKE